MFFCRKKTIQQLKEIPLEDITPRTSYEGAIKDSAKQDDLPSFNDYAQLCAITNKQEGSIYYVFHYGHEVYWHLSKKERSTGDRKNTTGWKIHISVASTEENVAKAWKLVAAKVIEYGIYETKVVGNKYLVEEQHQPGKEIDYEDRGVFKDITISTSGGVSP